MQPIGPAVAMLDIGDIPAGLRALDALAKEAEVAVGSAGTIQQGRFLILFGGEVEPVEISFRRAVGVLGNALEDAVMLPNAEERIVPSMMQGLVRWPAPGDTLGVVPVFEQFLALLCRAYWASQWVVLFQPLGSQGYYFACPQDILTC